MAVLHRFYCIDILLTFMYENISEDIPGNLVYSLFSCFLLLEIVFCIQPGIFLCQVTIHPNKTGLPLPKNKNLYLLVLSADNLCK